jgi:outer membrane receptor protein involved in Fe transport
LLLTAALLGGASYLRAQDQNQDPAEKPAPVANSAEKPAPAKTDDDATSEHKSVKMEKIEILGSRIHGLDIEGPSPVSTYNQDYIQATGAMTLADFLNKLPQNYSGISAGRSSAPNELNPEFGQRTETTTPMFNFILGASDAPPGQTGVSGVSLRGLGSGSTLVLVDGRRQIKSGAGNRGSDSQQGFVDLNGIPLGMIDHIEVLPSGASAIYGADAVAGVINIVLKKDYNGSELTGTYKGSFAGGGRERTVNLTSGFTSPDGKLRGMVSVDYYDRAALKASQRGFSRHQDHSSIVAGYDANGDPVMGRDLRLQFGYPGVVQAVSGTLNGIHEAGGNNTRFAVINDGITGTPTLADFTASGPGRTGGASYIVRGNTSEFLDLIPKSQRVGVTGSFNYVVNDHVEAYSRYSFADVRGLYNTQPPVTSAASYSGFGNVSTVVPAAYNPFGQNIMVGQIHYGFGSVSQATKTVTHSVVAGLRGLVPGTSWRWDAAYTWQKQDLNQLTRNFNADGITALYANPDPAKRLNPFLDARVDGNSQAALYETLALYPYVRSFSEQSTFDVSADGNLFDIWGGPVKMAVGGTVEYDRNSSNALSYSSGFFGLTAKKTAVASEQHTSAAYTEFNIPIVGKPNAVPGVQRLDLQLAGRLEDNGRAGNSSTPQVGLVWSPVKSLLVRGNYSEGFRSPDLTEYEIAGSASSAYGLVDPRRGGETTGYVNVTRGSNPDIKPETSTNEVYGLVFEPPFVSGLDLKATYYRTVQKDAIQVLSAQTFVNNEAFFADRVTRNPATPADTALGYPGTLASIDQSLINFGKIENASIDYLAEYVLPWQEAGRWDLTVGATRTLTATRELAPGKPALDDAGDTFAPPKWKYNASVFWSKGPWTAAVFVSHLSGFSTNKAGNTLTATYPIPSQTNVDINAGYTFKHGVIGNYGKGLRLNVGIGNLLDEDPPFSDTVFGYDGALHSPLGRTYSLSFSLPL